MSELTKAHVRVLPEPFLKDLKEDGYLHGIVERARRDETLMFAIRSGYVNVYYRGGNLIKIVRDRDTDGYRFSFDTNYSEFLEPPPERVKVKSDADQWVKAVPRLKEAIDIHLSGNAKHEREFQQLVARENNYSAISNETEYFVVDIELADSSLGARFDMVALQWKANRRQGSKCGLAIVEMKYGDGSLDGKGGLQHHVDHIANFLARAGNVATLAQTVTEQFVQLRKLGLVRFGTQGNDHPVVVDGSVAPEVIFLLANHNPRSEKLRDVIRSLKVPKEMDIRFFVARFAGYGLHTDTLEPLLTFRDRLERATH